MSGSETYLRIRRSLGLPSLRAAFAGLGHAAALLVFVIAATALKFTANNFPFQTSTADLASFARESTALGAALAVSVPLLVAACNLAPASGWRRYACLVLTTSASILACVGSPLPAIITGVAMGTGANNLTAVIVNNAASGYVKALQHSMFGKRYQSSDLVEMNYAAVAEAMGCRGIRVEEQGRQWITAQVVRFDS